MPLRPLHPELAEIAKNDLNETPEKMEQSLQEIKAWISAQPHLKARTDDQFLAGFLRGLKFDLDKVKFRLDLYYTCRSAAKEFFNITHRDPIFIEILETGCYLPLPRLSEPGAMRGILVRPGCFDPNRHSLIDIFNVLIIIDKILMVDDDNTMVAGNKSVIDVKDISLQNILALSPSQMKKICLCQVDSMPFRDSHSYYINSFFAFTMVLSTVTSVMLEDAKDERFYGENYEELYQYVPRDILPVEYGGTCGTIRDIVEYWKSKIEEYSDWLDEELQFGTDESKRVGPSTIDEDNLLNSGENIAIGSLLEDLLPK